MSVAIDLGEQSGMSRRTRRRAARQAATKAERDQLKAPNLDKPIGPNKNLELEEFAQGTAGNSRRYRNQGEHPLTLLFHREKLHGLGKDAKLIAQRRYAAGESFRSMYEATQAAGRTSFEPKVGGGPMTSLADAQIDAGNTLARIKIAMGLTQNFAIIEAFCGKGHSAIDALRIAEVPFAPQSVLPRICEALDVLVRVLNRPLPKRPPPPLDG